PVRALKECHLSFVIRHWLMPAQRAPRMRSCSAFPGTLSGVPRSTLVGFVLLLATSIASGQSSYPMLMSLKPLAAQIGQTTEHEVAARYNLYGAYQVFVSGTGVTAEVADAGIKPGEPPPEKKPEMPKIK